LYDAPRTPTARERVLRGIQAWAARQIERRVRQEWAEYGRPEIRSGLFGRRARSANGPGPKVSRSLIQINFYKRDG
jgi:hypothetical protein